MDNYDRTAMEVKIKQLEKENKYLKSLLDKAGISYFQLSESTLKTDEGISSEIVLNQHFKITDDLANRFFAMFWGRTDVYSKKVINKKTGRAGFYPQCENFWKDFCPKKSEKKIPCQECSYRKWKKLDKKQAIQHLQGGEGNNSEGIGIYPLLENDTCRFIVFDFDNHTETDGKTNKVDVLWQEEVNVLLDICKQNDIDALIERSSSGNGAHVWIFFQKAIPAFLARKFGYLLLQKGSESVNLKSFRYYDRLLPMQDHLPNGGLGNLIALPLQWKALKEGNSAFVDENWNVYPDQWKILFSKRKISEEQIEKYIKDWQSSMYLYSDHQTDEKPWERSSQFHNEDIDGKLNITLADAIYIKTDNLKPRIQNQIRRLAAFGNPEFYKNQAIGLSNYANSRVIYLGSDENGYIRIPRGLLDEIKKKCTEKGIAYEISVERCQGHSIKVEFCGKLRKQQIPAVEKMMQEDCGILSAATAFGKTVVCSKFIAEKKVNTLILLQSSALIEQWNKALSHFLTIDEALPEYETPTGRKKKRSNLIGKIQGNYDTSTGIIDIAMVGSLFRKGEFHPRLKEYGMIILDECHHAASDTIVNILNYIRARFIYGVTATPMRGDGLEKINYMMIGPIRYQYTSKERAKDQGIAHLVYPRFTKVVTSKIDNGKMHPNEAYEIIRNNEVREELILNDIKKCIENKRTPVILSKYKDQSQRLYNKVREFADNVFLLTGVNSKKEHRLILAKMNSVPPNETMILVATGKLIGEGFDFPRLDTLFMATPVAGSGVVEQYAGRLNRDYEGKDSVIIYDYIDFHIPMFDRMYSKRLKAYKQIGYEICLGITQSKQTAQAIYDVDNYAAIYKRDLLEVNKEIIISSPVLSASKVNEMISFLKEKQEMGIRVIVVTYAPDFYNYGDSGRWMELQEKMRRSGFEMKLVEEYCERYTILDQEIVWYGSMNFLAKEDLDDNLMRVQSKEIAAELMEITFGIDKTSSNKKLKEA